MLPSPASEYPVTSSSQPSQPVAAAHGAYTTAPREDEQAHFMRPGRLGFGSPVSTATASAASQYVNAEAGPAAATTATALAASQHANAEAEPADVRTAATVPAASQYADAEAESAATNTATASAASQYAAAAAKPADARTAATVPLDQSPADTTGALMHDMSIHDGSVPSASGDAHSLASTSFQQALAASNAQRSQHQPSQELQFQSQVSSCSVLCPDLQVYSDFCFSRLRWVPTVLSLHGIVPIRETTAVTMQ